MKEREESFFQDIKTLREHLRMQEARYDKMKTHAISQLELYELSIIDSMEISINVYCFD